MRVLYLIGRVLFALIFIVAAPRHFTLQELRRLTSLDTAHLPLEQAAALRVALAGVGCVVLAAGQDLQR